jgi:hypothetical protein
MTPRLFVRGDAAADLEAASDWYEERRVGLGGEFLRAARATLAGIARAPEQFPVARSRLGAHWCAAFRTRFISSPSQSKRW